MIGFSIQLIGELVRKGVCVCEWVDPTEAFVGKGVLGTVKTLLECSCFANPSLIIFVLGVKHNQSV